MTSLNDLTGDDLNGEFDSLFNGEDELDQMVQKREQEMGGAQQMNQPSPQMIEDHAPPQTNMQPEQMYQEQMYQQQPQHAQPMYHQQQEMYQQYMGEPQQSSSMAEKVFTVLKRLSTVFILLVVLFNPLTRNTLNALPFISHQAITYVILAVMFFSTYGTIEYFLI